MSSYLDRHKRIYEVRGKAIEYYCEHCGEDAQEWAQRHNTDGENPEDYIPLCCSCHQIYDNHWSEETRAKVGATLRAMYEDHCIANHEFDEENTRWVGPNKQWRQCRACARRRKREYAARKRG